MGSYITVIFAIGLGADWMELADVKNDGVGQKNWMKTDGFQWISGDEREMVMEALDIKFSNVSEDIHRQTTALNNRILLKPKQRH